MNEEKNSSNIDIDISISPVEKPNFLAKMSQMGQTPKSISKIQ